MASQTMTRKLSLTSPWKTSGGPGTYSHEQSHMNATAPASLRNPGDLGPVSMHIRTNEIKVPYIGDSRNRMEFGSLPKGEYSSPIKMGMHKRYSEPSLRAYNPTAFNHTVYDGPGSAASMRPNSMSFTQVCPPVHRGHSLRDQSVFHHNSPAAVHGTRSVSQQHD